MFNIQRVEVEAVDVKKTKKGFWGPREWYKSECEEAGGRPSPLLATLW